jgi:uncharacterized protein (TIGR00288 family)
MSQDKPKKLREEIFPGPRQVAFLVDGDNLSGQSWAVLLEHAEAYGHLAVSRLYMDFQTLKDGGMSARASGFEPIHVLGKRSSTGFKSMVDVALATDAMSVLYENPNINMLIIGTGDADFIPLIRHWKRRGRAVVVMANDAKLSNELRRVADEVVTFKGGRQTRSSKAPTTRWSEAKLIEEILSVSGSTRLNDRETNLPIVRVDWVLEQLEKNHPGIEHSLPDEAAVIKLIGRIPELEPIDGKGRTYLLGSVEQDEDEDNQSENDRTLDMFAEMCREVLPPDFSYVPASVVLNEGTRLLEDGAGLELPASRKTGWFRALMERTDGVEVKMTDRGHMQLRRRR